DFLLLPVGAASYSAALEMTVAVYRSLAATLARHGFEGVLVGDEGGFGPKLRGNEQAVELILEAITRAGYAPGCDAALALDVASTHFFRDGRYHLSNATLTADQMVALLDRWWKARPILTIERATAQARWARREPLTGALG